jgi:DNA-binding CsgD family transcriptional regulator
MPPTPTPRPPGAGQPARSGEAVPQAGRPLPDGWRDAPLTGRDACLREVLAHLTPGAGGSPGSRPVVLTGAAGVGKSRLLQETRRRWEAAGGTALPVLASSAASAVPFGALASHLPVSVGTPEPRDLARQVAATLRRRAGDGALLLVVVDDAPLLDERSAQVLAELAATQSRLLLAARDGAALPGPLAELAQAPDARQIAVPPLSRPAVRALAEAALGGPLGVSSEALLWHKSRGNPLFLRELLLSARATDAIRELEGAWVLTDQLPARTARLWEIVSYHLNQLPPLARHALELVALGEPVSVAVLTRAIGPEAVATVQDAALVTFEESHARCAHPLYGEVLREQMPEQVAAGRCRELVAAARAGPGAPDGADGAVDPVRLAVWAVTGGAPVEADALVSAGRLAAARFDFPLAERLARAALEAGDRLDAQLLLADALSGQGRRRHADVLLAALSLGLADEQDLVRVAIARASNYFFGGRRLGEAIQVLEHARSRTTDPGLDAQLGALLAGLHAYNCDYPSAVAVSEDVLARPGLGPATRLGALVTGSLNRAVTGRAAAALAAVEEGRRLARAHPELRMTATRLGISRCYALHYSGQLCEAELEARAGYEAAVREERFTEAGTWAALLVGRLIMRGRPVTAAAVGVEAVSLHRGHDEVQSLPLALAECALALAMADQVTAAETYLERLERDFADVPHPYRGVEVRARAWLAIRAGDLARARQLLLDSADIGRAAGSHTWEMAVAHDLARVGAPALAAERLATLAGQIEGALLPALLAHAAGVRDGDPDMLDAASTALAVVGADLLAAEAASQAASAYHAAGRDRPATVAALRAQLLWANCEGVVTPVLGPDRFLLSEREWEVATMAVEGLSTREIARRLFLSARTVDNHLARVYRRVGATGRDRLAALFATALSGPDT